MSSRPHPPSGLSDEAATAEYDLIHQAETEEQRLHSNDSMTKDPGLEQGSKDMGKTDTQSSSAFSKIKDTLLGK